MKKLLAFSYCLTTLAPISAMAITPPTAPLKVSITTPNPSWSLSILSIHKKDRKLIVICKVSSSGGIAASVMSKADSTLFLPKDMTEMQKDIYVIGQTWNYNSGYTPIKENQVSKITKGATLVYTALKPLEKDDFIGLTLEQAKTLAKKYKRTTRVIEIDGKPQPATLDIRPDRFNFSLKNGKITAVTKG